jgi:glutamate carboxypeptidase
MLLRTFMTIAVTILCFQTATAKALNNTENEITAYIQQEKPAQLSLLKKLVNLNSGTENIEGVRLVGENLRHEFDLLGFQTRWIEEPVHMHHAGTLIAEHPGKKGKRLLLIGHMDTVFPKNSAFQQFIIQGDAASGPGVIDAKGGDVIMLFALKAMQAAHALDDVAITVVLTGDEEDSGKPASISRKPLLDAAHEKDIALDFEWSITKDSSTVARRGITNWKLETQGKEAHSSEIFQKSAGDGANFELARILNTMRTTLENEKDLSCSPGLILGGTTLNYDMKNSEGSVFGKGNVIAKTAIAKGDLRFLTLEQKTHAEKTISALVAQSLPGTSASIHFQDGMPSMPPTKNNLALLKLYSIASDDLGYGTVQALDPRLRGAGDISYIAALVSANLAGLGPQGTGAHSEKEKVSLDSIAIQTERAALLMYRLTHE